MSAVAVESATGAVDNAATLLDVQQSGHCDLAKPEVAAKIAGPFGIRIRTHADVVVCARHAGLWAAVRAVINERRPARVTSAYRRQIDARDYIGRAHPAANPTVTTEDAEGIPDLRDRRDQIVVGEQELRSSNVDYVGLVSTVARADLPGIVSACERPQIERYLRAFVVDDSRVLRLELVAG